LDEVVADAERLSANGYVAVGKWNLGQVCNHLADWMTYPVAGFPKAPAPIALMLWLMKKTVGRKTLRQMLESKSMPAGKPTMPATVHPASEDAAPALARLREAAKRFADHTGEYRPSPIFGTLTRDEALGLQLVHCAHHLGFLLPK
jgi:hypothetical protein